MVKRKRPTYTDLLDCEKRALTFEEELVQRRDQLNRLMRAVEHFLIEPSMTPYSILEDALDEIGLGRREV